MQAMWDMLGGPTATLAAWSLRLLLSLSFAIILTDRARLLAVLLLAIVGVAMAVALGAGIDMLRSGPWPIVGLLVTVAQLALTWTAVQRLAPSRRLS